MKNSVSIATKPLVYATFRYLANKVHYALAEYIDNSVSSFCQHQELLSKLNYDGKVNVRVNIDLDNDRISISDDAFGIDETNFERAFELANIPLDAKGLNEFGMGMKVSSVWLSNKWSVETSAYGEPVKKTFIFDLQDVVDNQRTDLVFDSTPESEDSHYTTITLTNLSLNKPTARQISNIKKHLTSILAKFIRGGMLNLYVNDELLTYEELQPMEEPYYKTKGKPIVWKREISFKAPRYVKGVRVGDYKVNGFIGILNKMSNGADNGFLLFRRGIAIGTSADMKYRPRTLCGDEGSPKWKRIYGELEVEGFDVSFTKNSFSQDDQFEAFIEDLKEYITEEWKDFDIFGQAQNYTKPEDPQKKRKSVTESILSQTTKNVSIKTTPGNTPEVKVNAGSFLENAFAPEEESKNDDSRYPSYADPASIQTEINGYKFSLSVDVRDLGSTAGLYTFSMNGENDYGTCINIGNPYFNRFRKTFETDDRYASIVNLVMTLAYAELMLQQDGKTSAAKSFRDKFNELIGQSLQ